MKKIILFFTTLLTLAHMAHAFGVPSQGSFTGNHNGSTFNTTDAGSPVLGVRNDAGASTLATVNGGYGPVAIDQFGKLIVSATIGAFPLPPNASTATNQAIVGASVAAIGQSVVTLTQGRVASDHLRYDYSGASVVTTGYTTITAALANNCSYVDIFDSSGRTLVLRQGTTDLIYIYPAGNGLIPLALSAGQSISLRAISANATAGEFDLNCYRFLP